MGKLRIFEEFYKVKENLVRSENNWLEVFLLSENEDFDEGLFFWLRERRKRKVKIVVGEISKILKEGCMFFWRWENVWRWFGFFFFVEFVIGGMVWNFNYVLKGVV